MFQPEEARSFEDIINDSYDDIESHFNRMIDEGHDAMFDAQLFQQEIHRLVDIYSLPKELFISFFRNVHVNHVKKRAHIVQKNIQKLAADYKSQPNLSMIEIARKENFPPYLLARYLLTEITGMKKKDLSDTMRQPETLLSRDFSTEVRGNQERLVMDIESVVDKDPTYGPEHDQVRQRIGIEFEVLLEWKLEKLGIIFETESDLRELGTARTPDILLTIPLAVEVKNRETKENEWKMICWIDSKALFGDTHTHEIDVLPQLETYIHRFGPGLVCYWFGHAPISRLRDCQGDIVISGFDLPRRYMKPDGNILETGGF